MTSTQSYGNAFVDVDTPVTQAPPRHASMPGQHEAVATPSSKIFEDIAAIDTQWSAPFIAYTATPMPRTGIAINGRNELYDKWMLSKKQHARILTSQVYFYTRSAQRILTTNRLGAIMRGILWSRHPQRARVISFRNTRHRVPMSTNKIRLRGSLSVVSKDSE